jgi:hypothetical protein
MVSKIRPGILDIVPVNFGDHIILAIVKIVRERQFSGDGQ